jgi:hypothetical protein
LIAPETAKTLYARKSGKHNLDILLLRCPLRAVALRPASLRHRLSLFEEPPQAAKAACHLRTAAESHGQLPIYNELYVVERLLKSVAALDYPRELLQVQVLDDSTDETTRIAAARVEELKKEGLDIELIHRLDRTGFKAGALENGLRRAAGISS